MFGPGLEPPDTDVLAVLVDGAPDWLPLPPDGDEESASSGIGVILWPRRGADGDPAAQSAPLLVGVGEGEAAVSTDTSHLLRSGVVDLTGTRLRLSWRVIVACGAPREVEGPLKVDAGVF